MLPSYHLSSLVFSEDVKAIMSLHLQVVSIMNRALN